LTTLFRLPPSLSVTPRFVNTYPCLDEEFADRVIDGTLVILGKRLNKSLGLQLAFRPFKSKRNTDYSLISK